MMGNVITTSRAAFLVRSEFLLLMILWSLFLRPSKSLLLESTKSVNFRFGAPKTTVHLSADNPGSVMGLANVSPCPHVSRKMVVFDKDGTLGDCTASLRCWANHMSKQLDLLLQKKEQSANKREAVLEEYFRAIGWNAVEQNVLPSALLSAGTWEENVATTASFVQPLLTMSSTTASRQGSASSPKFTFQPANNDTASAALELAQAWHEELGTLHGKDPPLIDNLPQMLVECREKGWLVAVCTSDDRASTQVALEQWNIDRIVQYSICGDEVSRGKPSPVPLQVLCERASVLPQNCIVVGDTVADMGMATLAEAQIGVGVLTGSGTAEQLRQSGAHYILESVANIPELLEHLEEMTKTGNGSNSEELFTQPNITGTKQGASQ